MLAHDLSAHDLVHMRLEGGDLAREFLDAVKGHHADFGVFEGDRIAGVVVVDDAIEPDDLARHLKTGHLVTTIFGGQAGLEEAGAYGIQRGELLAIGEEGGASLDLAACGHQVVEPVHVLAAEPHGHAQLPQIAVGAGDFDGLSVHVDDFLADRSCLGSTSAIGHQK